MLAASSNPLCRLGFVHVTAASMAIVLLALHLGKISLKLAVLKSETCHFTVGVLSDIQYNCHYKTDT